jgi:hypothetical protein
MQAGGRSKTAPLPISTCETSRAISRAWKSRRACYKAAVRRIFTAAALVLGAQIGMHAELVNDAYRLALTPDLAGDWQKIIKNNLHVRWLGPSPDNFRNKAFADRWIYSEKLIPLPGK